MRYIYKILFVLSLILLTSCGSIFFVSNKDSTTNTKQDLNENKETNLKINNTPYCEECLIIPHSGSNKDLRYGYYYDQELGKCVQISYSTGLNCIPPPFKTLNECQHCCGGI